MCNKSALAAMLELMKHGESREAIHEAPTIIQMICDGALDQSSGSGDGVGGRHMDLGTIFEREVIGHLPVIRC